jgi:hypothetical protein
LSAVLRLSIFFFHGRPSRVRYSSFPCYLQRKGGVKDHTEIARLDCLHQGTLCDGNGTGFLGRCVLVVSRLQVHSGCLRSKKAGQLQANCLAFFVTTG